MSIREGECSESEETISTEERGEQAPAQEPVFFGSVPLTPSRKAAVKAKLVAQFRLRNNKEGARVSLTDDAQKSRNVSSSDRVKKLVEVIESGSPAMCESSKARQSDCAGQALCADGSLEVPLSQYEFESPLFSSRFAHKARSPASDFGTPLSRITAYSANISNSETTPHKDASAKSDIIATPRSIRIRARTGPVNSPSLCARRIATPKSVRMRVPPPAVVQVAHFSQEDIHSVPSTLLPIPEVIFSSCKPYPRLVEVRGASLKRRKRKTSSKPAKKCRMEPEFEIEPRNEAYINRITGTIASILSRNIKKSIPWIFKSRDI